MEEKNNAKHIMFTELDCAMECELKTQVGEKDLLLDIKYLISEYYKATFMAVGDGLKIAFNNGQVFMLTIAEVKELQKGTEGFCKE